MAAYGGLTDFVAAMVQAGELPRMRVALVAPGPDRNARYAANPAYTKALTEDVLPHLLAACPTEDAPVIMGQSLGALAALHCAWTTPTLFGGLFLQSGSFFTPDLDPQESGFAFWTEITSFVRTVFDAQEARPNAPWMALVCGSAEENYANNRLMAAHLGLVGVELTWGEVRDGHTWTCWRDTLHPHLTGLLRRVWAF
jgi:enterochelin esterase family protein